MELFSIGKLTRYLSSNGAERAFIMGCAIFVMQLFFLMSMESALAQSRADLRERGEREVTSVPGTPAPALKPISVPSGFSVPDIPNPADVGGTFEPAVPTPVFDARVPDVEDVLAVPASPEGSHLPSELARKILSLATAPNTFALGDLGASIKYCIVFPILNSAGAAIPTFNVPVCPPGVTPPGNLPRLTLFKVVVNDNEGEATTSDFRLLVGSSTVVSGRTGIFMPGSYVISEATTTVTVGTTTSQYTQSFSGDCDSSGRITLALGEEKNCTITNNDVGPAPSGGGAGGDPSGGGPSGGGPSGGGPSGGGPSGGGPSGGSPSGGSPSGGGPSGGVAGSGAGSYPPLPGQVLGAVTPKPEYLGGAEALPGVPNAGGGGEAAANIVLLISSGLLSALSLAYFVKMYSSDFMK